MNKRIFIIGVLVILISGLVLYVLKQQSDSGGALAPVARPTLAPPAPTGGIFEQPPNVVFSFLQTPTIPNELPVYSYVPASLSETERRVSQVVSALGFENTPTTLIRNDVYTKTWSRGAEARIVVTRIGSVITTNIEQAKAPAAHAPTTAELATQQLLLSLVAPTSGITVRGAGTHPGPFDGLLILDDPPPSSYTNFLYSFVVDQYPILTHGHTTSAVSVVADSGGVIRSAAIESPPSSVQRAQSIPVLTADQVLSSLTQGRGLLLSVNTSQEPDVGVVPAFSKFIIEELSVVYAAQNNLLFPAFYIKGSGIDQKGVTQKTTIFLWGFAEGANP